MSAPRNLAALLSRRPPLAAAVPLPDGTEVIRSRRTVSLQHVCNALRDDVNDKLWQPLGARALPSCSLFVGDEELGKKQPRCCTWARCSCSAAM